MTVIIKYCVITASDTGIKLHPQEQMESMGCKVFKYEFVGFADCAFMRIDKLPEILPSYVSLASPNYEFSEAIYEKGLIKVITTPAPENQKFPPKSFVKIADDLGDSMDNFYKGVYAQVEYTYAHAYWGDNVDSYCLLVRHNKNNWASCAWYYEHQLTAVTDEKLIKKFNQEINKKYLIVLPKGVSVDRSKLI